MIGLLIQKWFDSTHLLLSADYKKGKPRVRNEYDYYEDGSRKKERFYWKGRLKHSYNFTCDPKGKIEKKKVLEKDVCRSEDVDELGRRRVIIKTTTNGGVPITRIYTFNKENKKVLYQLFDELNELSYYASYSDSITRKVDYRKGLVINEVVIRKDSSGIKINDIDYRKGRAYKRNLVYKNAKGEKIKEEDYKKGKLIKRKVWERSADLLTTNVKYYNHKGILYSEDIEINNEHGMLLSHIAKYNDKVYSRREYTYNAKNLPITEKYFNRKNRLKLSYAIDYEYQ